MFDDNMFEKWLNEKAGEVFDKVGREEAIRPDEMIILVLKAQVNHFTHLDTDLRKDMRDLREDMSAEIKDLREEMKDLREEMKDLREDVNELRRETNDLRKEMNELRRDTNELRQESISLRRDMNTLREDMEKRFNRTQWLIGTGVAFLTVLMSFYQFLQ